MDIKYGVPLNAYLLIAYLAFNACFLFTVL